MGGIKKRIKEAGSKDPGGVSQWLGGILTGLTLHFYYSFTSIADMFRRG